MCKFFGGVKNSKDFLGEIVVIGEVLLYIIDCL